MIPSYYSNRERALANVVRGLATSGCLVCLCTSGGYPQGLCLEDWDVICPLSSAVYFGIRVNLTV